MPSILDEAGGYITDEAGGQIFDEGGGAVTGSDFCQGLDYATIAPGTKALAGAYLADAAFAPYAAVDDEAGAAITDEAGAQITDETGLATADFNAARTQFGSWCSAPGTDMAVPVTRFYSAASVFTYTTDMAEAVAAGVKVCLDFRPACSPVSATDLANLAAVLQTLASAGAVFEVSLWSSPSANGLTASQYLSAVSYYGPTVREVCPLVCCFGSGDSAAYYPGDSSCDKIAVNLYAEGFSTASNLLTVFGAVADNASPPKPLGIWELGASTDPVTGQSQAAVTAFFAWVQAYMARRLSAGKVNADILLYVGTQGASVLGNAFTANASFEGGLGAWQALSGCTVADSAAVAHSGSASMAITGTATGTASVWCDMGAPSGLAVTPGQQVSASGWLQAATTVRQVSVGVIWYSAAGTALPAVYGTSVSDSASGWTEVTAYGLTAPANAATALPVAKVTAITSGEVHYADDFSLVLSTGNAQVTTIQFPWDYRIPLWQSLYQALGGAPDYAQGADVAASIHLGGTDSCHGTDAGSVSAASVITSADVGHAGDGAVIAVAGTDASHAADAGYVAAGADSSVATDAQALAVAVASTDASQAAADQLVFGDSCHASDAGLVVSAAVSDNDGCQALDAGESATATSADAVAASDAGLVVTASADGAQAGDIAVVVIASPDSCSASEAAASPGGQPLSPDSCHAAEASSIKASLASSDTSHGADASNIPGQIASSDASIVLDASFITARLPSQGDFAQAADVTGTISGSGTNPRDTDVCRAVESGIWTASDSDSCQAAEATLIAAAQPASDFCHGTDLATRAWPASAETCRAAESYSAWPSDTDSCHGNDSWPGYWTPAQADSCRAADAAAVIDVYGVPLFFTASGQHYFTVLTAPPERHLVSDSDNCRAAHDAGAPMCATSMTVRKALAVTIEVSRAGAMVLAGR